MAEEKEEKKKPGIVRRILKWIGLGVLSAMIILGLIFEAPWKVITLLLIVLAACTVLPKPFRKWFWLSVGVVVIALVVWVFLPEADGEWRPYTFDEELAALEAKYAILNSENAAIIYNELLESYDGYIFVYPDLSDKNTKEIRGLSSDEYSQLVDEARPKDTFYPDFWNSGVDQLTISGPWSREEYPELAEWLNEKQGVVQSLMAASRTDVCRFAISINPSNPERMTRNSAMRRWAKLLVRAANNDLVEGRIDQALEKQVAVLQMGKHLCQQSTIIDTLTGLGIEGVGLRQLNRFLVTSDPTEEQLCLVQEMLAGLKHDWSSHLPLILEGEKLMAKNMLCSMAYEMNPQGKVRLSRNPTAAIRAQFPLPPPTYYRIKLAKAGTILGWFGMPATPEKACKIIDSSFERFYAIAEPHFDWQKEPKRFSLASAKFNYRCIVDMLLYIMEPTYYRIHDLYLRAIALQRGSQIIVALRRYKNQNGFWPVNLDDVKSMAPAEIFVDPTNGGDFVYEITEENFHLYSKGKNNVDDGGERDEKAGTDDWLIWPPRSRKAKEESTDAEQQ